MARRWEYALPTSSKAKRKPMDRIIVETASTDDRSRSGPCSVISRTRRCGASSTSAQASAIAWKNRSACKNTSGWMFTERMPSSASSRPAAIDAVAVANSRSTTRPFAAAYRNKRTGSLRRESLRKRVRASNPTAYLGFSVQTMGWNCGVIRSLCRISSSIGTNVTMPSISAEGTGIRRSILSTEKGFPRTAPAPRR